MNTGVLALHLLAFAYIGLLPRIFFRKGGRFHLWWWLTALPFLVSATFLILGAAGVVEPFPPGLLAWRNGLAVLSVPLAAGSIALISLTLGTHRISIALWHQANDAPREIVTWGAYGRIRHPFYASFLLALAGALVFFPHPGTLAALLYGWAILDHTARREEERLRGSEFGGEYEAYLGRTGRFWPRLRKAEP